jgi:hypothetical protein
MCECSDAACVRLVDQRFAQQLGAVVFIPEDNERVNTMLHESSRCEQRVLDTTPASTPGSGGMDRTE